MKNKHLGLVAVGLALLSLLVSIAVLTLVTFEPRPVQTERAQPAQTLSAGERRLVARLSELEQALPRLFAATQGTSEADRPAYASMFPPRARASVRPPVLTPFEVQMIYRVGEDAVALIDNALYRAGDVLPGGARLISVGSDSVEIREANQTRRIHVRRTDPVSDRGMSTSQPHARS